MSRPSDTDRRFRRPVIGTGLSVMILIFVLLCLLTFSVLSLVSARANMRLSQKSADHITAFYHGENLASDVLEKVISCLSKHQNTADEKTFLSRVQSELKELDGIVFTDDSTLEWSVPLSKNQYLRAEVTISYEPFQDGSHYKITSWNTYTDYEWGDRQR